MPLQISKTAKKPVAPIALLITLLALPMLGSAVIRGPILASPVNSVLSSGVENVGFTGQVTISSRIIDDSDFHGPTMLELTIDFDSVKGLGRATGKRFVSEARTIVRRPLLAFDEVEAVFPYAPNSNPNQALSAKAVISVSFNPFSGLALSTKIIALPADVLSTS
ncbi:hypothetical protein [Variovorax sp. RHLX14]|uniref:hypothetical protein n=1 Tax=Variovorax sp. RHLX14 TaxID=1259731 RepID=UPI003F497B85